MGEGRIIAGIGKKRRWGEMKGKVKDGRGGTRMATRNDKPKEELKIYRFGLVFRLW